MSDTKRSEARRLVGEWLNATEEQEYEARGRLLDSIDALTAEHDRLRENRDYWMKSAQEAQGHRDGANLQLGLIHTELAEARADAKAGRKLWAWMVENELPWSDPDWQETLAEMGLLVAKDMTLEDSGPECLNCCGDCDICWRVSETLLARTEEKRDE